MPKRLILIRHGQSEGNIDHSVYASVPDSRLHLTDLGWRQARAAGKYMRERFLKNEQLVEKYFVPAGHKPFPRSPDAVTFTRLSPEIHRFSLCTDNGDDGGFDALL